MIDMSRWAEAITEEKDDGCVFGIRVRFGVWRGPGVERPPLEVMEATAFLSDRFMMTIDPTWALPGLFGGMVEVLERNMREVLGGPLRHWVVEVNDGWALIRPTDYDEPRARIPAKSAAEWSEKRRAWVAFLSDLAKMTESTTQ